LAKPFDTSIKKALEQDPTALMRLAGLDPAGPITVVNSDLSTVTAEADLVFRIEDNQPYLVLFEVQSGHDRSMPRRLLRYHILLDLRYDLRVQSVLLLLCREADSPEFTSVLDLRLPTGDRVIEFRYRVVRLWEVPVEMILEGGIGGLPLAPLANVGEEALEPVVDRVIDRIGEEIPPATAHDLWLATFILMGLKYPEEVVSRLVTRYEGVMESVTYEVIRKREFKRHARQTLLRQGQSRLGPADAETRARIEAIDDLDRLDQLLDLDRMLRASSWDELLAES
jgi:hypothetical protein